MAPDMENERMENYPNANSDNVCETTEDIPKIDKYNPKM